MEGDEHGPVPEAQRLQVGAEVHMDSRAIVVRQVAVMQCLQNLRQMPAERKHRHMLLNAFTHRQEECQNFISSNEIIFSPILFVCLYVC